jgi:homoserine dehydrogenase
LRIILCGFGVVGQSLVKLFESRAEDLYAKYGLKPRVVGVFDSKGSAVDPSGLNFNKLIDTKKKFGTVKNYADTKNSMSGIDMLKNVEADVLIETTASNYKDAEPGMTHIITAMKKGMHVISVNKGPLALAFPSLLELATYNQVMFKFSGTVGGGTPILDYAKNSLSGERITSFAGILNGTTNYILTNMGTGETYEGALKDAKDKGYVEADETLDLDGLDAAAKLVILANWIMGMKVTLPDIDCTGIRKVTVDDIKKAAKNNCAIKLIASCNKKLVVGPKEVPNDDPLCVNGTLNAIAFTSEHSGTQTIIGKGAGGMETASSILRDLLDIRQEIARD